jgi:hypothetical protein
MVWMDPKFKQLKLAKVKGKPLPQPETLLYG